jgi:hypothetical protein
MKFRNDEDAYNILEKSALNANHDLICGERTHLLIVVVLTCLIDMTGNALGIFAEAHSAPFHVSVDSPALAQ